MCWKPTLPLSLLMLALCLAFVAGCRSEAPPESFVARVGEAYLTQEEVSAALKNLAPAPRTRWTHGAISSINGLPTNCSFKSPYGVTSALASPCSSGLPKANARCWSMR